MHVLACRGCPGGVELHLAAAAGDQEVRVVGDFTWRVAALRTCIGAWSETGRVPCPSAAPVVLDAQCPACCGLENPACVFEPACQADPSACRCLESFAGVEHVVYLALYGTLPKVGMTQRRRLDQRLVEQGADAYFVVQGGLDRPTARLTERTVAFLFGLPEHRSHREVLAQMPRAVPWDLVDQRAAAWRERLASRFAVEPDTVRLSHPVAQPLPGTPRRIPLPGLHRGTWLGAKGNHLFYAAARTPLAVGGTPLVAVKRSDLVGRHVALENAA